MTYVDDTNILDEAVSDADLIEQIKELISNDTELQVNIEKLRQVKDDIMRENLVQKVKLTRSSKLSDLLNGEGSKIIIQEETDKDRIVNNILEGYHLTSVILQQLHIIRKVDYTITYLDSKGNFNRMGNMEITPDMVRLEAASKGRGYSLRLQQSVIKARMEASKTDSEAEAALNRHFQTFAKPFFDYENNNNTGWRANRGVIAEAFERHWEKLQHAMDHPEGMTDSDIESIGERWLIYRLSSGSDPYFTGPDTLFAQVKNANASLIDNLNTVINTINAILLLVDNTNNIQDILIKARQAFKANPEKQNISKKIWDGLEEDVKEEMLSILGASGTAVKGNNVEFIFDIS